MSVKEPKTAFGLWVKQWNIPNVLTIFRLILTPVFIVSVLMSHYAPASSQRTWLWTAIIVFIVSMFTDQLDGYLARKYSVVTDFGKMADPIADKVLILSAFICLSIIGTLPWWVTILILIRELGITIWRFFQLKKGNVVPASKGGKLKTVLQTLSVVLMLWPLPDNWTVCVQIIVLITLVVTLMTGAKYIWDARKLEAAHGDDTAHGQS